MKILIIYGTTEGQTRKIARFLKDEAEKAGHDATLSDASDNPPDPDGFDRVIIGASLHVEKYQSPVKHYATKHYEKLNQMPTAFFSVSLSAAGKDKDSLAEISRIADKFCEDTGWRPRIVEQVAGALLYTQYDFFKRFIMRMISKKSGGDTDTSNDYEYTDWEQVKNLLSRLLKES